MGDRKCIHMIAEMARNCPICNPHQLLTCKRCGVDMAPGIAMGQTFTAGAPDFPGSDVVTLSNGGPGKVIACMKCPECGWSVTGGDGDG